MRELSLATRGEITRSRILRRVEIFSPVGSVEAKAGVKSVDLGGDHKREGDENLRVQKIASETDSVGFSGGNRVRPSDERGGPKWRKRR